MSSGWPLWTSGPWLTREGVAGFADVEDLERVGRSRALHYVGEAVPQPDSVAAARVNGASVSKVGLAC